MIWKNFMILGSFISLYFLNLLQSISFMYFRRTSLFKNWIWDQMKDTMCTEKLSLSYDDHPNKQYRSHRAEDWQRGVFARPSHSTQTRRPLVPHEISTFWSLVASALTCPQPHQFNDHQSLHPGNKMSWEMEKMLGLCFNRLSLRGIHPSSRPLTHFALKPQKAI